MKVNVRIAIQVVFVASIMLVSCESKPEANGEIDKLNSDEIVNPTNSVLLSSEIEWEQLNPARGDKSPQAGTIWGDRKGEAATGFLAKFVDGFSSPPHIHNVTYRAVVIKGLIHNDDENAKNMWMKPGSFWTQPEGESHITSSKGESIALVEIDNGPYLVKPISEAFDNGERPINIDASNIVWLDNNESNWIDSSSEAKLSILLETSEYKSLFIKLPEGYNGEIVTEGSVLHSVIIQGELNYILPQNSETNVLDPGSSFSSSAKAIHTISNTNSETIVYMRTNGNVKIY